MFDVIWGLIVSWIILRKKEICISVHSLCSTTNNQKSLYICQSNLRQYPNVSLLICNMPQYSRYFRIIVHTIPHTDVCCCPYLWGLNKTEFTILQFWTRWYRALYLCVNWKGTNESSGRKIFIFYSNFINVCSKCLKSNGLHELVQNSYRSHLWPSSLPSVNSNIT